MKDQAQRTYALVNFERAMSEEAALCLAALRNRFPADKFTLEYRDGCNTVCADWPISEAIEAGAFARGFWYGIQRRSV